MKCAIMSGFCKSGHIFLKTLTFWSYVATSETFSESTVTVLSNYVMNAMIKVMNSQNMNHNVYGSHDKYKI